jgi:D-alanine-D-alanine ligase
MRDSSSHPDGGPAPQDRQPLRVTVLCGGPSAEREISLESGRAVADALRRCGHEVFVADIGPADLSALDHPADVVFPALHGTFGEDGTLQGILSERGIRYVGSDERASRLAIDKAASKVVVREHGMDTAPFEVWDRQVVQARRSPGVDLPLVIKPVDQGSSVGTCIIRKPEDIWPTAAELVAQFERVLLERFIEGEELTVGIIGGEPLPPICVRTKRPFYDFIAKYEDQGTEYLFDAGYPAALLERAQSLSARVFACLGCRHLARVDWIVDPDQRLWFLEINTLPGFTGHSLVPKAAAREGVTFEALVDRLVQMAIMEES